MRKIQRVNMSLCSKNYIKSHCLMHSFLLLFFFIAVSVSVSATEWSDVTGSYIVNSSYADGTSNGWTVKKSVSVSVAEVQSGVLIFTNKNKSAGTVFEAYQEVTGVPNGKYRLGVQGYYRCGSFNSASFKHEYDSESLNAELYANNSSVPLMSIMLGGVKTNVAGSVTEDGEFYFPESASSIDYFFNTLGRYHNYVEFEVTDGRIRFGVKTDTKVNADVTAFDSWTLEYEGKTTKLQSLKFEKSMVNLIVGESSKLGIITNPETVESKKFVWTVDNKSVASVSTEGVVTALSNGTTKVTCRDEISGLSASCTVTVSSSTVSSSNVIINEIQASNIDQFVDPSFNYGGWVELYNPSDKGVDLGGCYIMDHKGNEFHLRKDFGIIHAGGFLNLWFDHNSFYGDARNQIDFKLDLDGGTIIICDSQKKEVTRFAYPAAIRRTSYARKVDGAGIWGVTSTPSPLASNNASVWVNTQIDAPVVNTDAQLFTGSLSVKVTIPAGQTLMYTTDGSTPTLTNGQKSTNGSFTVTNTATYRFRLFQEGYIPSEVVTRSYIKKDKDYVFSVVSVVTENKNLYSDEMGLFVKGTDNGRPGNGKKYNCNWNMDWERPVNFEYIKKDGSGRYNIMAYNQEVDLEMCGGWSRAWDPHSFKIKANSLYGKKFLDYPFFSEKPYIKNQVLQLRNAGNDHLYRFKDVALQEIVKRSGLYIDTQAWEPVHVFVNGNYHGVLNMREPNNRNYAYSNYGISNSYLDQFEMSPDSAYIQKFGTKDKFLEWLEKSKGVANDAIYKDICDNIVDIDEYINYMCVELYLGGTDWPQNNVKGFRARKDVSNGHDDGRFHFVLFDLDGCLVTTFPFNNLMDKHDHLFKPLLGVDPDGNDFNEKQIQQKIEFVTIFLNMLNNETFRKKFVDSYCIITGSVFEPSRCKAIIDELCAKMNQGLKLEMVKEYKKGNGEQEQDTNFDLSDENGEYTIRPGDATPSADFLRAALTANRQSSLISTMSTFLSLKNPQTVSLSSNVEGAKLLINGIEVPTDKFSGTLYPPVTVKAVAPAGYDFVGWRSPSSDAYVDVFGTNSNWRYYDAGALTGSIWKSNMDSYRESPAPFCSAKASKTVLKDDAKTAYFSKTFNLDASQITSDLKLSFGYADGFVVYVNGKEALRHNMADGTVSYSSHAIKNVSQKCEFGSAILPKSLFVKGKNIIAVEVHLAENSASAMYWDAALLYKSSSANGIVSTSPEYPLSFSEYNLVAMYAQQDDDNLLASSTTPIKINEVGAGNDIYINEYFKKEDWIELYNTTDTPLDVAGLYISDSEKDPTMYKIEANPAVNTVIEPHGFLVIWADGMIAATQPHATFALKNADDKKVIITSSEDFINNNFSYFAAHPEFVRFADAITYKAHAYNQSCGRYPDGGDTFYVMNRPTIGKPNSLISYDRKVGEDNGYMDVVETFPFSLSNGWNWISHPLASPFSINVFDGYATRIVGQTLESVYDTKKKTMVGPLTSLKPSTLYKVNVSEEHPFRVDGTLTSSKVVALKKGWNWIGYPCKSDQSLSDALEGSLLEDGDMIVGQIGISQYSSGRGWAGTLRTLSSGEGFMYRSMSAKAIKFVQPSEAEPQMMNLAKSRNVSFQHFDYDRHAYPNVMGVIAKIDAADELLASGEYHVAAYSDGECRGEGECIDGVVYITMYGEGGEPLTFELEDADGYTYYIIEEMDFVSDVLGTCQTPVKLTVEREATGITSLKQKDLCVGYYNMSGLYVGNTVKNLRPGVYVAKYASGKVGKIMIK